MAPISAQGKRRARGRPHGPRRTHGHAPGSGPRGRDPARLATFPRARIQRPSEQGPARARPAHTPPGPARAGRASRPPASPGRSLAWSARERRTLRGREARAGVLVAGSGVTEARRGAWTRRMSSSQPTLWGHRRGEGSPSALRPQRGPTRKLWALAPTLSPFLSCPLVLFGTVC